MYLFCILLFIVGCEQDEPTVINGMHCLIVKLSIIQLITSFTNLVIPLCSPQVDPLLKL